MPVESGEISGCVGRPTIPSGIKKTHMGRRVARRRRVAVVGEKLGELVGKQCGVARTVEYRTNKTRTPVR